MRFTSFIVAGTLALVASAQTTDSTATSTVASTASTTVSLTAAQSSEAACLQACKAGDVDCQAKCISVSPYSPYVLCNPGGDRPACRGDRG